MAVDILRTGNLIQEGLYYMYINALLFMEHETVIAMELVGFIVRHLF